MTTPNYAAVYANPLLGKHVIVTSGPTREPIDPVRYVSNRSSGQQGHAIAAAFAKAGADVTLISGPVNLPDPANVKTIHVETAQQMLDATLNALPADVAIFTAAVADWKPKTVADHKMKKRENEDELTITFVKNPDILKTVGHHAAQRPGLVIGFAAETHDVTAYAQGKLTSKNADMILANDVSGDKVMGSIDTHLLCITKEGVEDWGQMNKTQAADKIIATVANRLQLTIG